MGDHAADRAAGPFVMSNAIYGEAGRSGILAGGSGWRVQESGGFIFAVAGQGFEKREERGKSAARGGIPASTTATAVPPLKLTGRKQCNP